MIEDSLLLEVFQDKIRLHGKKYFFKLLGHFGLEREDDPLVLKSANLSKPSSRALRRTELPLWSQHANNIATDHNLISCFNFAA